MLARRRLVLLLVSACAVFTPAAAQVTINVDAALNRHAIDPRIYGVAWAPDTATVNDLGVTINRWGGNAMSRYNWEFSTANRCKDWYFENIADSVSSGDGSNGKSADDFIGMTIPNGAQPIITIPVMGLLPRNRPASPQCGYSVLKYGAQDAVDPWNNDCGNGKQGGVRMKGINDPADTSAPYTSAHQGSWIQHLVATWGSAASGGVRYYALDNEPALWSFDHWDVHPNGSTYDEVWSKMADYGAVIKANDPTALTTGIEEWGWSGYFDSGLDAENYPSTADRDAHGGVPFAEWLLQQARTYEQTNGVRIIDFATVHFYPQGGEFSDAVDDNTRLLRNRSTRSLWDPNYVDESWIGTTGIDGGIVRLIPRLREWAANDYPGTKIGITEYNWGAESNANGATAQADILGIFGREGLDLGVRWTSPPSQPTVSNVYNAFKMYRNYDGSHSRFGDISVSASGPNPDSVATFAALRSTDHALTVMVINKDLANPAAVTVNVANYVPGGPAQVWRLDAANAITRVMPDVAGAPFSLSVPATSITLLVIPGSYLETPAGVVATASSTTSVNVSWSAVAGATYRVYRSSLGGPFVLVSSPITNSYTDSGLSADTTYLYKVQAVSASLASGLSATDPATTTIFTDDPVTSATPVRSVHIAQLRTAVNAMRRAAGLPLQAFTDDPVVAGTTVVKAVHLKELRSALEQAREVLGVDVPTYADVAITAGATAIRTGQITEIRNGVK